MVQYTKLWGGSMNFIFYENGKDFVDENLDLLLKKEWLNNLIVGNCADAVEATFGEDWLFGAVKNNDITELILLYRAPWKLTLYSPTGNTSDELYKYAAEEVYKLNNHLPGVNTENIIGNKFAKYYCELSNQTYKVHIPMRILVLEKLAEPKLRNDVTYRRATEADLDTLIKFQKNFNLEALHEEKTEEEILAAINRSMERGYFLLEKDGKIVAQTVSTRRLIKGKGVSGVYTPPEERHKGYAYNLVYRVSKELLDNGAEYCVLYTDDSNPISNHVYEKIGYVRKADTSDIDFI